MPEESAHTAPEGTSTSVSAGISQNHSYLQTPFQNDDIRAEPLGEKEHGSAEPVPRKRMGGKSERKGNDCVENTDIASNTSEYKLRFNLVSQFRATILYSPVNVLLIFVPAGFAVRYTDQSPITIFAVNFIAIMPVSNLLGFAVDEVGYHVGETIGGIISMSFSNAVQLISSIFLLKSNQLAVLQTSMIGAILSSTLLMAGLGMFAGGFNRFEQYFNSTLATVIGSLLLISTMSLMVPTVTHIFTEMATSDILRLSRGTSIILLIIYGLYLFFQLKTHAALFAGPHPARARPGTEMEEEDGEEVDAPELSIWTAVLTIVLTTTLIAFSTSFATDSIRGPTQTTAVSQTFVGMVLLPLLSNDVSAVLVAMKDRMELCIALTIGKSLQAALLVAPLLVIIAWWIDVELSLLFGGFEVASLFTAVLIVNYLIQDGRFNWLQGALLIASFVIIATAAFFVP